MWAIFSSISVTCKQLLMEIFTIFSFEEIESTCGQALIYNRRLGLKLDLRFIPKCGTSQQAGQAWFDFQIKCPG